MTKPILPTTIVLLALTVVISNANFADDFCIAHPLLANCANPPALPDERPEPAATANSAMTFTITQI